MALCAASRLCARLDKPPNMSRYVTLRRSLLFRRLLRLSGPCCLQNAHSTLELCIHHIAEAVEAWAHVGTLNRDGGAAAACGALAPRKP